MTHLTIEGHNLCETTGFHILQSEGDPQTCDCEKCMDKYRAEIAVAGRARQFKESKREEKNPE